MLDVKVLLNRVVIIEAERRSLLLNGGRLKINNVSGEFLRSTETSK